MSTVNRFLFFFCCWPIFIYNYPSFLVFVQFHSCALQYYALDITYFKSSLDSHLLDLLWNKYWVNTLSSSPLLGNGDYVAGQISDLGTIFAAVYTMYIHVCVCMYGCMYIDLFIYCGLEWFCSSL